MKCNMSFNGILIGVNENEYKFNDGKTVKGYTVSVEQNDEAGICPCDKSVYDLVKSGAVPKYSACQFSAYFDTDNKKLRVFDAKSSKLK